MYAKKLLFVLTLLLLAPSRGVVAQVSGIASTTLRPGDRVRLEVAGDSTLTGDFDVDADGWVLVPVAGLLRAVDRPFGEVAGAIVSAFREEYLELPVRVLPLSRISVLGEVTTPGLYWIDPTIMLADVLAWSGGLSSDARVEDIRLQREGSIVVFSAAQPGPIALRSGDRVFVGRRSFVSRNGPILIGASASILTAVITGLILR